MTDYPLEPSAEARQPAFRVFRVFFRLGASSFGGPAMVPYIRRRVVNQLGWVNDTEFREGLALCQVVPGATTMQLAGWIGLQTGSVANAGAAFVAFGLPAVTLMVALAAGYQHWGQTVIVTAVFAGLQAVIVAILANATVLFARSSIRASRHVAVAAGVAVMFALDINPALVIVAAAATAVLFGPNNPTTQPDPRLSRRSHLPALLGLLAVAAAGVVILAVTAPGLADLGLLMGRIDLFAFGGGFGSLPLMYHEVLARHWMTPPTFLDGVALGQITPGPIVITATFVGYIVHGLPGALVATIGVFLPSFVIVVAASQYVSRLRQHRRFDAVVSALSSAFVGLLAVTTARFAIAVPWDAPRIVLATTALVALLGGVDILWIVLTAAAAATLLL
ncbi:MAG: chromate efflux transporter [Acidimicrobiia bacterium]